MLVAISCQWGSSEVVVRSPSSPSLLSLLFRACGHDCRRRGRRILLEKKTPVFLSSFLRFSGTDGHLRPPVQALRTRGKASLATGHRRTRGGRERPTWGTGTFRSPVPAKEGHGKEKKKKKKRKRKRKRKRKEKGKEKENKRKEKYIK